MKKSRKNRLLCILLSLAMVLTLLPGMSLTAYAYDTGERVPEGDYLTFTAEEDDSSVTVKWSSGSNVTYKLNDDDWRSYTSGTKIDLNIGDNVRFRGKDTTFNYSNHFSITGKVAGSGDVASLRLDDDGKFQGLSNSCFQCMFMNCTGLTKAPKLSATTLAGNCYYRMFYGCTSLAEAPVLSATDLPAMCYSYMFSGCTSLTEAPELPATTLADGCYRDMFDGCTRLTEAPDLPATRLANSCYTYMFNRCTSLAEAPNLPATTLANSCYYGMFYGCTGLTKAPALPATELADYCYYSMFDGCTRLTEAPDLPATVLPDYCYYRMFSGCTGIQFSDVQSSSYWYEYTIPAGNIPAESVSERYALKDMFNGIIGIDSTPTVGEKYYMKKAKTNVTGVSLDKSTATLTVGETVAITATISPSDATNKKLQWTSSDASVTLYSDAECKVPISTVASNDLTVYAKGNSAGSSTVTVKSLDDETKTASCTVNVIDPKLPDGKFAQTATVDNVNYTRYVYVLPLSALDGKKKATFTVTKGDKSIDFETNTYYTGVTSSGTTYVPASEGSVMLVCTVKGGLPNTYEGGDLTCTLKIDGEEYSGNSST